MKELIIVLVGFVFSFISIIILAYGIAETIRYNKEDRKEKLNPWTQMDKYRGETNDRG